MNIMNSLNQHFDFQLCFGVFSFCVVQLLLGLFVGVFHVGYLCDYVFVFMEFKLFRFYLGILVLQQA